MKKKKSEKGGKINFVQFGILSKGKQHYNYFSFKKIVPK
jgi:hypothetical protein